MTVATLTSDQLTDLRGDIGDNGTTQAFTDAELQRLYTRAETYDGAVALARRQLLANSAKFFDYTAGETSEKREQVFKHLQALVAMDDKKTGMGHSSIEVGLMDQATDQQEDTVLSSRVDDDEDEWETT